MAIKPKMPPPPSPNYDLNVFNEKDHQAQISTVAEEGVSPTDLKAALEVERDHYTATALIAGLDPRDKKTLMPFPGYQKLEKLFDRGIASAVATAQGAKGKVHATVHVSLHSPTPVWPIGDEIRVSVTEL